MIRKGDLFKMTGISKKDAYYQNRKQYNLYNKVFRANENLHRWEESLMFCGEAMDIATGDIWFFHSIQLKRVKD
jgi:hypothetical protein